MSKLLFLVSIALLTFSLASCAKSTPRTTPAPKISKETRDSFDIDSISIMNECNETFRTEMSYIESLNTSGSFPDETDKTPKCFVRCILEKSNVISDDGSVDIENALDFFAMERTGTSKDQLRESTNTCSNRNETCICERSYEFIKCVVQTELNNNDAS